MSQHDLNIANQTFPGFRADLNNFLLAISSQQSGASDPATTEAFQLFADTTNDVLKQRNSGDSAYLIKDTILDTRVPTKTTAFTVALSDMNRTLLCDTTGGAFTATLPVTATAGDGFEVTLKRINSGANDLTIDGDGSETIDGQTTIILGSQFQFIKIRCNGTSWFIVSGSNYVSKIETLADIAAGNDMFANCITLDPTGGIVSDRSQTISDDGVHSFVPTNNAGFLMFFTNESAAVNSTGVFTFRSTSTEFMNKLSGGSLINAATGVLTGTTGTDGY